MKGKDENIDDIGGERSALIIEMATSFKRPEYPRY